MKGGIRVTLEQRRDLLRADLAKLLDTVVELHTSTTASQLDNPFLTGLEAQMAEKTAQLDRLNALVDTPLYRLRKQVYAVRFLFWIGAVALLLSAFFMGSFVGPWLLIADLLAAALCLSAALWTVGFNDH